METVKGLHEEEEEDEFSYKKDASNSNNGKNCDKANVLRSKHSVTEQRRRIKINERFQILRDLVPNTDQKRDTASFLLEVIQYVQYLQERVQKYEGPYQAWGSEPTKLMPWSFAGSPPQAAKNSSKFAGMFDENHGAVPSTAMQSTSLPASDALSSECPNGIDDPSQEEELPAIEGGTISFSSVYSQGLLNSLGQALQSTGVDLSHATVSVQINLGKRVNRGLNSSVMAAGDRSAGEDWDQAQKRPRT